MRLIPNTANQCKHENEKALRWLPEILSHPSATFSQRKEVLVCGLCGTIIQESEKDELEVVENGFHGDYIGIQELLGIIPSEYDPYAMRMNDLVIL